MARIIRTSDGDRLDTLCFRAYGSLIGTVEAVLDANPELSGIAQPFPSGIIITLPDLNAPTEKPVQLWS